MEYFYIPQSDYDKNQLLVGITPVSQKNGESTVRYVLNRKIVNRKISDFLIMENERIKFETNMFEFYSSIKHLSEFCIFCENSFPLSYLQHHFSLDASLYHTDNFYFLTTKEFNVSEMVGMLTEKYKELKSGQLSLF